MASNREFLMLAHDYNPAKDDVRGWYVSEKLDGTRCWWDGGVSRGKPTTVVPWANIDKTVKPEATGLWSRYGNVISAPGWFLDKLPQHISLDGELWSGRGSFQQLRSAIAKHTPIDSEWENVRFVVFEAPSVDLIFFDREIKNTNFNRKINEVACKDFVRRYNTKPLLLTQRVRNAEQTFNFLREEYPDLYHEQDRLSLRLPDEDIQKRLEAVTAKGGEGLMLRRPDSYWTSNRTRFLLKVKRLQTAEGRVVGYISGMGKYLGMMGSLTLRLNNGKELNLSGFTDLERAFPSKVSDWCTKNEACIVPYDMESDTFPRGLEVKFMYRELSDDGIPKEARYMRESK